MQEKGRTKMKKINEITGKEWNNLSFEEMMEVLRTDPDWHLTVKWFRWYGKELVRRKKIKAKYPDFEKELNETEALTLFYQAHPPKNEALKKRYKQIEERNKIHYITLKWGKCEECGYEGTLSETGLNWVCDHPECERKIKQWYDDYFAFRNKLRETAKEDFASIHYEIRKLIIKRAREKGVPVLQEWIDVLEGFIDNLVERLDITEKDARSLIPELIKNLDKKPKQSNNGNLLI